MLVSIIIPTYNRTGFIVETINSALAQTYSSVEIIVVDDGSTDNTSEALKQYIDEKKIVYHFQQNAGRSIARNKGAELSKGDYLLFLDSDDLLLNTAIENLISLAKNYPESQIFSGKVGVFQEGEPVSYQNFNYPKNLTNFDTYGSIKYFISIGAFIIARALFLKINGFEKKFEYTEDVDLSIKALMQSKLTWAGNFDVVHKRRHSSNTDDTKLYEACNFTCDFYTSQILNGAINFSKKTNRRLLGDLYQKMFTNNIFLGNKIQAIKCFCKMNCCNPHYIFSFSQWKFLSYLLFKR